VVEDMAISAKCENAIYAFFCKNLERYWSLNLFWSRLLPDALTIKVGLYRLVKRELVHGQTILVLLHSHRGIDSAIF
jgi:hypothetical protein